MGAVPPNPDTHTPVPGEPEHLERVEPFEAAGVQGREAVPPEIEHPERPEPAKRPVLHSLYLIQMQPQDFSAVQPLERVGSEFPQVVVMHLEAEQVVEASE